MFEVYFELEDLRNKAKKTLDPNDIRIYLARLHGSEPSPKDIAAFYLRNK